jgi:hypothetical protein
MGWSMSMLKVQAQLSTLVSGDIVINFLIDTKVKLTFSNIIYEVKIKCSKQEAELTGQNYIT